MRYALVVIAVCLTACSVETQMYRQYADVTPTTHHIDAAPYGPEELEVRLGENRAWVGPTVHWWRLHILSSSGAPTDRWIATVESQRVVYEKALMMALASRATCRTTSATPVPGYFAFEFTYECGAGGSP
jgi:hypothetical protein